MKWNTKAVDLIRRVQMQKTLVLVFHPNLAQSKANKHLVRRLQQQQSEYQIIDMYQLYPDGTIDVTAETKRLLSCSRLVLQFPVFWYSTPPLLKAWQDAVLTPMYYLNYATEGALLQGLPVLLAATAGNTVEAYSPQGSNKYALEQLFIPLQATAHRCGWAWHRPFVLYQAHKATAEILTGEAERYLDYLRQWQNVV
jgi:putative NADPH-quinone reductase